jgi:hypothetical protein
MLWTLSLSPSERVLRMRTWCQDTTQEDWMSEAKRQSIWTWEAYLDWEFRQPIRYELVDGQVHAMDGRRNTIPSATICAPRFMRRCEASHAGCTARTTR